MKWITLVWERKAITSVLQWNAESEFVRITECQLGKKRDNFVNILKKEIGRNTNSPAYQRVMINEWRSWLLAKKVSKSCCWIRFFCCQRGWVDFTNILWAHLRQYSCAKKSSNLIFKCKKAACKTFVQKIARKMLVKLTRGWLNFISIFTQTNYLFVSFYTVCFMDLSKLNLLMVFWLKLKPIFTIVLANGAHFKTCLKIMIILHY